MDLRPARLHQQPGRTRAVGAAGVIGRCGLDLPDHRNPARSGRLQKSGIFKLRAPELQHLAVLPHGALSPLIEPGVRVGPNLDSDADIDAEARGELPDDLVVQTGKLLLGAERGDLDAAVEALPDRWRSVVSGTGWTLGPWQCIEASARCRLHGPCSGISLGIPGSSDWFDQQQRRIQGRRGTPAETEADIAPVFLPLREAEDLPAFCACRQRSLKNRVVLQARQVELLATLLPYVQGAGVLGIVLPEPVLQHLGQMDRGPLADEQLIFLEHALDFLRPVLRAGVEREMLPLHFGQA